MAKDTNAAFKGMVKKEASGTKLAGKPIKKSPSKGKK